MESRKRTPPSKKGSVKDKDVFIDAKLDKLADDIKNLPPERQDKLKNLLAKKGYSTKDAAQKLGISLATLRRMMKAGKIPFFRVGSHIRISLSEIDRYNDTVNLRQAADILGVHKMTVTKLINLGKLPAQRIGWPYRIKISDLEKFIGSEDLNG